MNLPTWMRGRGAVAAVAVVVLLVIGVVWVVSAQNDGGNGAGNDAGATLPAGGSSTSTATTGSTPTEPSSSLPSQVTPSAAPPVKHIPKPVHASLHDQPAKPGDGVTVTVTKAQAVNGQAHGVGEVAGPAIRFTVQVHNGGAKPIDLGVAVLTAYYGPQNLPAIDLSGPGEEMLPQTVKAGATGTGRYVFRVPESQRNHVRLDFSYDIKVPRVIFTGSA
jgi:hypothetical protein